MESNILNKACSNNLPQINTSEPFLQNLMKLLNLRYEKLLKEKNDNVISDNESQVKCCNESCDKCDSNDDTVDLEYGMTSTQSYKEESNILQMLINTDDNRLSSSFMIDSFKPIFKLYYQMQQLLPDTYKNYFPLHKNNLPNKFQDKLDDILHDRINVMIMKIFEEPIKLRNALRQLTQTDWIIMTFSRASIPFLHKALDMFQCKPEHMKVLLSIVPTPVWYCPWHVDENGLTPIQALTRYIWYFNPKSEEFNQRAVHTLVHNKLSNQFRFLKIKELLYDFDPICMFNNLSWYLNLKLSEGPDLNIVEEVNFNLLK